MLLILICNDLASRNTPSMGIIHFAALLFPQQIFILWYRETFSFFIFAFQQTLHFQ